MTKSVPNERIVFVEEAGPDHYIKVVVVGDLDEDLLDALAAYVERRQRRRLPGLGPNYHKDV